MLFYFSSGKIKKSEISLGTEHKFALHSQPDKSGCILLQNKGAKLRKGANTAMNSKQVNETVNKLFSFMQDVKNGDLRTILEVE